MEIKHRHELMRKANAPWLAAQTAADFHRPPHAFSMGSLNLWFSEKFKIVQNGSRWFKVLASHGSDLLKSHRIGVETFHWNVSPLTGIEAVFEVVQGCSR